ncbi:MAG: radical SAM protein [Nitrosopumilus sp.]
MKEHKIDLEHRMDSDKLLWHMPRVMQHFDKGERVAPVYLDMGVTKKCNLSCIYCFGASQHMTGEIIQRDALLTTFHQAPRLGVKAIGIIGDGEPTLNPHIYEAMDVGKKGGLDMAFSTNGILLDDGKMENILRNCTWMRFNLSAGTREGYKRIHRADRWDVVTEHVRRMVELRDTGGYTCEIGLQSVFVPTEIMTGEVIPEAQLALDIGVDYFLIKQCSWPEKSWFKHGMVQFDLNLYDEPENQELLQRVENMSTERTKIIPKWSLIAQKGERPYDGCPAVPLISEISGNGDWYPCAYMFSEPKFEEYRFGNLHEKSLQEILESERYWRIIDMMKTFDVHNDPAGACRLDKCNEFVDGYLNKPRGVNFV